MRGTGKLGLADWAVLENNDASHGIPDAAFGIGDHRDIGSRLLRSTFGETQVDEHGDEANDDSCDEERSIFHPFTIRLDRSGWFD